MIPLSAAALLDVLFPVGLILGTIVGAVAGWLSGGRAMMRAAERTTKEYAGSDPHPLSRSCPGCGSADYRVPDDISDQFLLLVDRVCTGCGQRYTCPPSRLACAGLIALGVSLIVSGATAASYMHYALRDEWGGYAAAAVLAVIGISTIHQGAGKLQVVKRFEKQSQDDPAIES